MSTLSIKMPHLEETQQQITQSQQKKCISCNCFFGSEQFKGSCSACYRKLFLSPEEKEKSKQNAKKTVPETVVQTHGHDKPNQDQRCCGDQEGSCKKSCTRYIENVCGCIGIAFVYMCCWPCICCGKTGILGVK